MPFIDPNSIVIRRDERQRKSVPEVDDLVESIRTVGQIQPIVVQQEGEALVLRVGERRTLACRKLGKEVEYKLWNDLTPDEAEEVEYEENRKRKDLTWREDVEAIGKIHSKRLAADPTWTHARTGERLSLHVTTVGKYLLVYKNLNSPTLAQAQTLDQAYSILQRVAERRTSSIVEALISAGQEAFDSPPTPALPILDSITAAKPPPALPPAPVAGETQVPLPNGGAREAIPLLPESRAISAEATPPLPPVAATAAPPPTSPQVAAEPAILNQSFLEWGPAYSGPKFNLIHIDFPYGIKVFQGTGMAPHMTMGVEYNDDPETYAKLLECFCSTYRNFTSYSAHLMFWFSMNSYTETKRKLESAGWWVHEHPLFWLKSDGVGMVPGRSNEHPRRIYETAFLASIGKRTLVKAIGNAYSAPTASNPIHPSVKPEPVLRYFFSGLVDQTTDLFDPTCGSGSAIRAGEDCGARRVLGLEINAEFARNAESLTQRARLMRRISR